ATVFMFGPLDALGAQRVSRAHHVEDVPAAAAVLPFARIGVDQVAPEQEARHFVVEAYRVVAHAYGFALRQFALDLRGEFEFRHAALEADLRRDAGDEAGLRIGEEIGGRLAIHHQRLADLVQFGIGADAGKLGRAVAPGLRAE